MGMILMPGDEIVKSLLAKGLIPRSCKKLVIVMEIGEPIRVLTETLAEQGNSSITADIIAEIVKQADGLEESKAMPQQ